MINKVVTIELIDSYLENFIYILLQTRLAIYDIPNKETIRLILIFLKSYPLTTKIKKHMIILREPFNYFI